MDKSPLQTELERRITELGLNMKQVSLRAGLNETMIRDILTGRAQSPRLLTLQKIAKVLGCSTSDLIHGGNSNKVLVVGYISSGGELHLIDNPEIIESVDALPGSDPELLEAAKVIDDSNYPALIKDYVVFYEKEPNYTPARYISQICFAKVKNGKTLYRTIQKGYSKGKFNLQAHNAPLIEDVELEWVKKVEGWKQP